MGTLSKKPLVTDGELEEVLGQAKTFYRAPGGAGNATHLAIVYSSCLLLDETRSLKVLTRVLIVLTAVLAALTLVLAWPTLRAMWR